MSRKEAIYILVVLLATGTVFYLATPYQDTDQDCGCDG